MSDEERVFAVELEREHRRLLVKRTEALKPAEQLRQERLRAIRLWEQSKLTGPMRTSDWGKPNPSQEWLDAFNVSVVEWRACKHLAGIQRRQVERAHRAVERPARLEYVRGLMAAHDVYEQRCADIGVNPTKARPVFDGNGRRFARDDWEGGRG